MAPWVGIGSCVLLLGLLLATVPLTPIGAEVERLIGPWLGWQDRDAVNAPPSDRGRPTPSKLAAPELAAGRDDPQPGSMPVWAGEDFGAAAGPRPEAPPIVVPAPAPEEPAARSVPVPALKPALRDR